MKVERPSPAMVVALTALVMSTTGAAIAAVEFARNAGAVDGKSAVGANASNRRAAGKLVATDRAGRLPSRFLDALEPARSGARVLAAPDNALGPAERIVAFDLGSISMACFDQQPNPGVENPATRFYVTNFAGRELNIAYRAGGGQGTATVLPAGGAVSFVVGGQGVVEVHVQGAERSAVIHGAARQIGQGSADGTCAAFATALVGSGTG
jgi:hypothetical protein